VEREVLEVLAQGMVEAASPCSIMDLAPDSGSYLPRPLSEEQVRGMRNRCGTRGPPSLTRGRLKAGAS
jgi:hypothetical protein